MTVTPFPDAAPGPSRAATVRQQIRAHSRLIHTLRWVLPAAGLALLGVLGFFVISDALRDAAARPVETPSEVRMVGPHFVGRDDRGRAFNMSARFATRDDADLKQVYLADPVMTLDVDGQHPATLTADRGVYREDTRLLHLYGHVRVDNAKDSTATTDQALVDTRAGSVQGAGPLAAHGPSGALSARSYTATDRGDHLILRGGVHGELKGR